MNNPPILIRGGGDLATGTIHRLWSAGFPVVILETEAPAAIRRQVSFCEAIYNGSAEVEGVQAIRINHPEEAEEALRSGKIPILADASAESISYYKPNIIVDAILAKKNLGTTKNMAPLTIALGPGFCAGEDVDIVIETKRGHNLGRIIRQGFAAPNTGIPGIIAGYGAERVMHASAPGCFRNVKKIGDIVKKGEIIAYIQPEEKQSQEQTGNPKEIPVEASLSGILRGLLRDGYQVTKGFKLADIDPRLEEIQNCFTISDKSRCIAGSVLEVVCGYLLQEKGKKCF